MYNKALMAQQELVGCRQNNEKHFLKNSRWHKKRQKQSKKLSGKMWQNN